MGPQLVRCGMSLSSLKTKLLYVPFNGAATCSLRNALPLPLRFCSCDSFNGAATCSLRNGWNLRRHKHSVPTFNGAATCSLRNAGRGDVELGALLVPSMGPQLVRCGMVGHYQLRRFQRLPSMGPQLVRCGMLCPCLFDFVLVIPSMGPQLVRCGMVGI